MNLVDLALLLCPREFREGYRREFHTVRAADFWNIAWTGICLRFESVVQDAAFATRSLLKAPLFAGVAIVTLALAVSINATVFGAIDAILLKPLPFVQPESLVFLCPGWHSEPYCAGQLPNEFTGAFQRDAKTLSGIAAWQWMDGSVTGFGVPRHVRIAWVSTNIFRVLSVAPELGRAFISNDGQPGVRNVIISDEFWRRTLAASPSVVGTTLHLDGASWRIVGVAPRGTIVPVGSGAPGDNNLPDIYEALPTGSFKPGAPVLNDWVFARTALGRSGTALDADVARVTSEIVRSHPISTKGLTIRAVPFVDAYYEGTRMLLNLGLALGVAVLLIACANIVNLLLARYAGRRGEIALRNALGASRGRILQQLTVEIVVLATAAGVVGLLLAHFEMQAIALLKPYLLPAADQVRIDGRVIALTSAVVLGAALLSGVAPALVITRRNLQHALKEGGRNADMRAANVLRSGFAAVQIALAFAVIVASGLLYHSFLDLSNQPSGMDARNVVIANASLYAPRYASDTARARFIARVVSRVRSIPGVLGAAVARPVPYTGEGIEAYGFRFPGRAYEPGVPEDAIVAQVTPDYFKVLSVPLVAGRQFTASDTAGNSPVAIVERSFARHFFAIDNCVGKRVLLPGKSGFVSTTIVGEAADTSTIARPLSAPVIYVPEAQHPSAYAQILVKTSTMQRNLNGDIAAAVAVVDPLEAVDDTFALQIRVDEVSQAQHSAALLVGILAVVSLLLAVAGLYGVLTYGIEQREHEIGVRMAVGARAGDIVRGLVFSAIRVAMVGIGVGVVLAAVSSTLVEGLLVDVSRFDPITFAGVVVLLLLCAIGSALIPAARAVRLEPSVALRYE